MKVMTRNLFVGADLRSVYEMLGDAAVIATLPDAVAAIYHPGEPPGIVQRTAFDRRARLLAAEIAEHRPDVVGLQEAARWQVRDANAPTHVDDHLDMLEEALVAAGAPYERVATVDVGDVELPGRDGTLVRLRNRCAILARQDTVTSDAQTGTYRTLLPIRTAYGTFELTRGWAAVDVGGVRLITTHLEVGGGDGTRVQRAQALELVEVAARLGGPVVAVGDFNARPGTRAYRSMIDAGFEDAWSALHPGEDGFTCCHRVPLDDPADGLRRRIDHVFLRGPFEVTSAVVVDAFTDGMWPSDHAGVVVEFR